MSMFRAFLFSHLIPNEFEHEMQLVAFIVLMVPSLHVASH